MIFVVLFHANQVPLHLYNELSCRRTGAVIPLFPVFATSPPPRYGVILVVLQPSPAQ